MFDKEIKLKASVLESHAAQLRAEAMAFLYAQGEEYTECLNECIVQAQQDESEHKRIFGVLAEIGFCSVFCGAAQAGDEA